MRRDEDGSALVEFSWLSILLLVPMIYLIIAVFQVQSAAYGLNAASRAAARAYSIDQTGNPGGVAQQAADVAMRDQGRDPVQVQIDCSGGCNQPGGVVTVRLNDQVILPLVPDFLGDGRPSFRLTSTQQIPYGLYRPGQG